MKRVHILDPSCDGDLRAHHVNSVTGHAHAFTRAGCRVVLCANARCSTAIKDTVVHPVFPYTIYDDVRKHHTNRHIRILKQPCYFLLANKIYHLLKKIIDVHHINGIDHIFIPTLDWILFQALARLYAGDRTMLPSLHLLLMYEKANWMTGGYPYLKILQGIRKLQDRGKNIFIYTETRKHAMRLQDTLGFVPDNYPFPALPVAGPAPVAKDNNKIRIGVLGGGRRDKGYNLLPDIIRIFNKSYTGSKEVIFIIQRARREDLLEKETGLLKQIKNVVLLENRIPVQVYENNLLQCHVALFPYSDVYATRGSGAVNEAVANGIPIICSGDTALAEAITCGNGLTAATAVEFALAIINIIGRLDFYTTQAKNAKESYLDNLYGNPVIRNINSTSAQNE